VQTSGKYKFTLMSNRGRGRHGGGGHGGGRKRKKVNKAQVHQMIKSATHTDKPKKYMDVVLLSTNSSTTAGYEPLTLVPQGVAQGDRIGDVIYVTRMEGTLQVTTANADLFNLLRSILFVWKQNTSAAVPGANSIVESISGFGPISPLNFEGQQYYHVLRDKIINLSGSAASPANNSNRVIHWKIKFPGSGHRIQFNEGVTTGTGHLYWLNYSDSALAPFPNYSFTNRIHYNE